MSLSLADRAQNLDKYYYYDEDEEERFARFCAKHIKLVEAEWAGQPFILSDWQRYQLYGPILSWKRRDNHKRRFQTAYITMARKNAKTTGTGAMKTYSLVRDNEAAAENFVAAQNEDKAKKMTRGIIRMVQSSPFLSARLKVNPGSGIIYHPKTGGFIQPVSSEATGQLGSNPNIVTCDEYQEQKTDDLKAAFETGMAVRQQPLLILQGTAGDDIDSEGFAEYQFAKMVLKGEIFEPSYFAFIREAAKNADPFDEQSWIDANPGYPLAPKKEFIEKIARRAKYSPKYLRKLRQFHCNQWVQDLDTAIQEQDWERCSRPLLKLSDYAGCPAYLGIDLADTNDLTAICFMVIGNDGIPAFFPYFFGPEDCIARNVEEHKVPYDHWKQDGHFIATSGLRTDYEVVARVIEEEQGRRPIKVCHYDPHKSYQLVSSLEKFGIELVTATQHPTPMGPATREIIMRIQEGRLYHPNHPILNWNSRNARLKKDAKDNWMFSKELSRRKMDGMVAMALAIRGAIPELTGADETGPDPIFW